MENFNPVVVLVAIFVVAPIGLLVGTILLRAVVKYALEFELPFSHAFLITLGASVVGGAIKLALRFVFSEAALLTSLLALAANVAICTMFYAELIHDPRTNERIGAGKAMLVTSLQHGIVLVVGLVVGFVGYMLVKGV